MHRIFWLSSQVISNLAPPIFAVAGSSLRLHFADSPCLGHYYHSSPAGLSRGNGVRRSSAKTGNFNPSPKAKFHIN